MLYRLLRQSHNCMRAVRTVGSTSFQHIAVRRKFSYKPSPFVIKSRDSFASVEEKKSKSPIMNLFFAGMAKYAPEEYKQIEADIPQILNIKDKIIGMVTEIVNDKDENYDKYNDKCDEIGEQVEKLYDKHEGNIKKFERKVENQLNNFFDNHGEKIEKIVEKFEQQVEKKFAEKQK